ncbi:fluoride efflux transporter FluC [Microbacterium lacticum]
MVRRAWFSPAVLLLVIAGGAAGVALRAVIVMPLGGMTHPLVVPAATLVVNLAGAFLLGVVVGWLADRHPRLRAFLGTGVMGGFTTYSAFAVQSVTVSSASPLVGLALVAVSLFGGLLAAAIGLGVGGRIADRPGEVAAPEDAE